MMQLNELFRHNILCHTLTYSQLSKCFFGMFEFADSKADCLVFTHYGMPHFRCILLIFTYQTNSLSHWNTHPYTIFAIYYNFTLMDYDTAWMESFQRDYRFSSSFFFFFFLLPTFLPSPSPPTPGSRRPSLASVHSTTSSVRSYSMRRFEQEIHQKELRQEMKKHLSRLQEQQQLQKIKPNIIIGDVISCPMNKPILTTPSPMTPNSIDDLLPSVDETQEVITKKQV